MFRWIVLCLLGVLSYSVNGHTLKMTTTEITWHPNNGQLEVVHSVHLDDAMLLLARLGDVQAELPVEVQAQLMVYLDEHFQLNSGAQTLPLTPIGAQVLGDTLWLYQESPSSISGAQLMQGFTVDMTFMQAYYAEQQHLINLHIGSQVKTLQLNQDSPQGTFETN